MADTELEGQLARLTEAQQETIEDLERDKGLLRKSLQQNRERAGFLHGILIQLYGHRDDCPLVVAGVLEYANTTLVGGMMDYPISSDLSEDDLVYWLEMASRLREGRMKVAEGHV